MGDAILTPFTVNPGKVTELHLNISQRNKVPVSPSDAKMRVASIAPELESFRLVDANELSGTFGPTGFYFNIAENRHFVPPIITNTIHQKSDSYLNR